MVEYGRKKQTPYNFLSISRYLIFITRTFSAQILQTGQVTYPTIEPAETPI